MFKSVHDALCVLERCDVSSEEYICACIYLIEHRHDFSLPIFICRPERCTDDDWEVIKADTEALCFCGGERVLMPVLPRTRFEEGLIVKVSTGSHVDLKPLIGERFSTYVRVEVSQEHVSFSDNPFASAFVTLGKSNKREYELVTLAQVVHKHRQSTLMYKHSILGFEIGIFRIEAVDILDKSITITLDRSVELCLPDEESGCHICLDVNHSGNLS